MAAQMTPRFRDLPDVDWPSFADGEVPTYDSGTDKITGETGGVGGATGAAGGVLSGTYPNPGFDEDMATQAELDSHNDDSSFVHGVTNMADLATDVEVATAVSNHSADTTSVHGITDTTALATDAEVAAAVAAHAADVTAVHGILDANGYVFTQKNTAPANSDLANGEVVWWADPATGAAVFKGKDENGVVITMPVDDLWNLRGWWSAPGDLLIGGADAPDYLPTTLSAGTDGQVLTADSGASEGLAWETPTGGVDQTDIDNTVATHSADTTSVHGIADTTVLATDTEVSTAVSDHSADTTSVHGVADTTVLATDSEVATAVSDHSADTTAVHGIADTSALASLPIAEANVTGLTAALAAKQPLDSDLTAIAALTTTSFGRSLLEAADAPGAQTTLGVSTFIKTLLDDADAATARTTLGVTSAGDGGHRYPVYITGKLYGARHGNPTPTAGSMSQSRAIYTPFQIDTSTTFDRIGIHVSALVASLVYRLGIYNYSATTGAPGTLVLDAGTVSGASTGQQLATISQTLAAGTYYFVCVPQSVAIGAATIYQLQLRSTGQTVAPMPQTAFDMTASLPYRESVTGALPDPAAAVTWADGFVPHVMLRAA